MRDFNIVASARYQVASRQVGDITVNSYHLPEDAAGGQKAPQPGRLSPWRPISNSSAPIRIAS